MKNKLFIPYTVFICMLIITGCNKKNNPTPTPTPTPTPNIKPVAKAPADTAITLPVNSLTLTGTGTDKSGTIVGYLWSQISGPAEASITNEGSASATIKSMVAGKYLFQFAVTDNKGLTGIDSVYVTVNPAKVVTPTTLTLAPANNPTEFCLGVWNGNDWSNGTSIEEPLSAWTKDGNPTTLRDLLKFDLSSIPATATIIKADLYLYSDTIPKNGDLVNANSGTDNSVLVQQVASSWDPATLNWFNQPAGLTANQVIVPSTTLSFLNVDINVQALVGSMVSSGANYGFKLSLQNEVIYTSRIFCSSYYSDASRHPRLVITYK